MFVARGEDCVYVLVECVISYGEGYFVYTLREGSSALV